MQIVDGDQLCSMPCCWLTTALISFIYTTVVGVSTTSRCHCVANSQRFRLCSGRGFLPRARPLPVLLVTGGGYLGYHHYWRSGPQEDGAPPHLATPTEVGGSSSPGGCVCAECGRMCRRRILESFFLDVRAPLMCTEWDVVPGETLGAVSWGIWRSCLTLSCEWWLLAQLCWLIVVLRMGIVSGEWQCSFALVDTTASGLWPKLDVGGGSRRDVWWLNPCRRKMSLSLSFRFFYFFLFLAHLLHFNVSVHSRGFRERQETLSAPQEN